MQQLERLVQANGIAVNSMESRVKTESSLAGKLQRKGFKYQSVSDITDVVGARIVVFYNEDVDRIASQVESLFDVDWENSVDKRKQFKFDSFGYSSLHYICSIPKQLFQDPAFPRLNEIRFELQMRTALQHVWSSIQHDIGYKTEVETPVEYHRCLSRLAGLLELADKEFSLLRMDITNYRRQALAMLAEGQLDQVPLDGDTFRSYMEKNPFDKLNRRIAVVLQAELQPVPADNYLVVLKELGMETIADVERMKEEDADDAYQLALAQLANTDLDILASTVGLQNLCLVHTLKLGGGRLRVRRLLDLLAGESEYNDMMAESIMERASRLSFMG